ncbi:hypothetical protein [Nocardioides jishulii]|uniref:WD40 repeat domain-containing protein n=1 Tax=Nocardioides jishulii TaxID=2575440 RepID=A0A4U2YVW4_9ACTN|nr:hypothetical protein [Nocardioides jishulii]QCX28822.1 hypothetical protein FCL41_15775 [Nocardioides jishulii]TKI64281.1 hypothetical protein FC770_03790 [Nocardioides jishulii]
MTHHDTLEHQLRVALHDMADRYEPAPLPRDLWQRGRASQPRPVRLELVAATIVLVALLASMVALTHPGAVLHPADVPEGGALPTDVWLPDEFADRRREPLSDEGAASLATMLDDTSALLVDAETGEHRVRELVDVAATGRTRPWLALAPDGTRLAHPFRSDVSGRQETKAGVAINSLVDGGAVLRELSNADGLPIAVQSMQWSPDGTWLAWTGAALQPAEGWASEAPWIGVMDLEADRVRQWQLPTGNAWGNAVAVADDGTVVVTSGTSLWQLGPEVRSGVLTRGDARRLPGDGGDDQGGIAVDAAGTVLSTILQESGEDVLRSRDIDLTADPLTARYRTWIASDQQMALWMMILGRTPDNALLALDDGGLPRLQRSADGGDAEVITQLHSEDGNYWQDRQVTVAVGLGDTPPVTFTKPAWARDTLRWFTVGLVVVLVLFAGLLFLHRRRSRDGRGPAAEVVGAAPVGGRTTRVLRSLKGWARAVLLVAVGLVAAVWLRAAALPGWLWIAIVIAVAGLFAAVRLRRAGRRVLGGLGLSPALTLVLVLVLLYASQPVWPALSDTPEGGPALPRVAHVPAYDDAARDGVATPVDEVDVDRASALVSPYAEGDAHVVLVDADTGRHHLVDLPGSHIFGMDAGTTPFVLSHDGRRLAWAYADFETDEAGIALFTLGGMEISRLPLVGRNGAPVRVDQLSWSPDASHLVWWGDEAAWWNDANSTFTGPMRTYGVTATDDLDPTFRTVRGDYESPGAVAVDDTGTGRLLVGRRLLTFTAEEDDDEPAPRPVSERALPWSSGAVSADGSTLALGVNGGVGRDDLVTGLRTLDLTDPEASVVLHPWDAPRDGDRVDVLGFSPGGSPVVAHTSWNAERAPEIVVVDSAEGRMVSTVSEDAITTFTVASDLAERPTLDVSEPRWPVSDERWTVIGLLAALLAFQVSLTWWRRRRRPSSDCSVDGAARPHM